MFKSLGLRAGVCSLAWEECFVSGTSLYQGINMDGYVAHRLSMYWMDFVDYELLSLVSRRYAQQKYEQDTEYISRYINLEGDISLPWTECRTFILTSNFLRRRYILKRNIKGCRISYITKVRCTLGAGRKGKSTKC